jgi:predicted ester cyclase
MSVESTREVMMRYLEAHDENMLDQNAIFTVMATGHEARGREAIGQFVHAFYHEIFDAEARLKDLLIAEDQACFEAELVGRQVREFAGIAPTGREICVPFCVVYELAHGKIIRGHLYFETDALHQQASTDYRKVMRAISTFVHCECLRKIP